MTALINQQPSFCLPRWLLRAQQFGSQHFLLIVHCAANSGIANVALISRDVSLCFRSRPASLAERWKILPNSSIKTNGFQLYGNIVDNLSSGTDFLLTLSTAGRAGVGGAELE